MTLTKSDRTKLIDEMKEVFVTKEELGTAIADLVKQLPSKKEQMADKLEILSTCLALRRGPDLLPCPSEALRRRRVSQ